MATLNGLNRYDGNSLITFRPQKSKKISLADHRVKVLEEDQNGFFVDYNDSRFNQLL